MDRERERRLKELDKAGAIEGAQLAQGEIARLSQEQRNNLQQEKMALSQQAQERAIISQAAEMGVATAADISQQGNNQGVQAPGMNAQTQQILSKYGINPNQKVAPKTTTTTRSTTKQGATIVENITNTTTTNHNVVRVIQPNIPIAKPNIAMRQGAISNAKFKTWLQKANAQQEELANSQMNDYNRRERSLLRSTDRMMKKLQDLSKTIGRGLDPENMTNSVSGSLKTLMFLFIATMIPLVWKPLMEKIEVFEANFRSFFGMDLPGDLKTKATTVKNWKAFLGLEGKDLDEYGVPGAVGKLIKSAFDRLLAKLELEKKDREKAIARLENEKPDSITDIEGWVKYLGKVAAAAVGGSEAQATYTEGSRVSEEKTKELENEEFELEGKKISMLGEFDEKGELRNEDSALKLTQSIANETQKETVDISKIQTSLEKLRSFSKNQDKLIPLSPEFVNKIKEIVPEERILSLIEKYKGKGEYRVNQDDYVFTTKKSDYDPGTQYSICDRVKEWQGVGGSAGAVAGAAAGALPTAGFGIAAGGAIGYMLGSVVGSGVGLVHGLGDMASAYFKAPGGQLSLVPLNSLSEDEKRTANFHKTHAKASIEEVSPEFINELLGVAEKDASKNAFKTDNYAAIKSTLEGSGKKVSVDASYQEAANNSQTLKLKKAEEDSKDTQVKRFENNVKSKVQEYKAKKAETSSTGDASQQGEPTKSNVSAPADKNPTAKKIIEYLKEKLGLTKEQAAGVAGNLYVESGGFNLQAKGDKGTSYGLAQWHNERKDALFNKTGTSESNPPNLEQQLDYLIYELSNSEKRALLALKNASTVKDSALVFAQKFERPAKGSDGYPLHFDRRWKHAEDFYNLPIQETTNIPVQATYTAANFTPTQTSESAVSKVAENVTTMTADNSNEMSTLSKIAETTQKLAETTGLSAQLDAIPRQHNVVNNVTQAPFQHPMNVGWASQT